MRELLIGCGHSRVKRIHLTGEEAWGDLTTLDSNPACKPDVLWDLNNIPLPFTFDTFDRISAFEVLEHCGKQGDWKFFFDQFADLYRIIKPGGFLLATCPHHGSPWAWSDPSHTRIIALESLVFLDQDAYEQVGKTAMSDFRDYYKANWKLVSDHLYENGVQCFILQAIK